MISGIIPMADKLYHVEVRRSVVQEADCWVKAGSEEEARAIAKDRLFDPTGEWQARNLASDWETFQQDYFYAEASEEPDDLELFSEEPNPEIVAFLTAVRARLAERGYEDEDEDYC